MTKPRELRLVTRPSSSSARRVALPPSDPAPPPGPETPCCTEDIIRRHIDNLQVLAIIRPKALKAILRLTENTVYPKPHRRVSHGR